MSKHVHDWKLVDSYDSWKRAIPPSSLPEGRWVSGGLFGPIYIGPSVKDINEDIGRRVIEVISRENEPHFTSETWVCNCGKRKTNSQTTQSMWELLTRGKKH